MWGEILKIAWKSSLAYRHIIICDEIMSLYEKVKPNNFHRYKGLGETSEAILEKAVMNPAADRVLIQYTMDDIKETIETIRDFDSDKKKILSLVGNITRDDIID